MWRSIYKRIKMGKILSYSLKNMGKFINELFFFFVYINLFVITFIEKSFYKKIIFFYVKFYASYK